jgi:aminoglycoside 6'-N-acetyltransferase
MCVLRPVRQDDFEHFDRELFNPESLGPYQWFGYRNPRLARDEFRETAFLTKDGGRLTIEVDGQVAGRVQWRIARWGSADTPHCWELGFMVFPQWRGRGVGREAGRQLVDYLFNQSPVMRIQSYTDVENHPAQRLLESGGFQKEGVIRGAQWRQGTWHDQILYSLLRDDWLRLYTQVESPGSVKVPR